MKFYFFIFILFNPFEQSKTVIPQSFYEYNYCIDSIYYTPDNCVVEKIEQNDSTFNVHIKTEDGIRITYSGLNDIFVTEEQILTDNQKIGRDNSISDKTEFIAFPYSKLKSYFQIKNNRIIYPVNKQKLYSHENVEYNIGYDISNGNYISYEINNIIVLYSNLSILLVKQNEISIDSKNIGFTGNTGDCKYPQLGISFVSKTESVNDFRIIYFSIDE